MRTQVRYVAASVLGSMVQSAALAQVGASMTGRWLGSSNSTLEIAPTAIRYGAVACDEGRCRRAPPVPCRWSASQDALRESMGGGVCQFSTSRHAKTRADILGEFDAWTKRDAGGGPKQAAIAKKSRRAIEMLSPSAPLQVVVLNAAGDVADLNFDGTHLVSNGRDKSLHAFDKVTELKTTWARLGRSE